MMLTAENPWHFSWEHPSFEQMQAELNEAYQKALGVVRARSVDKPVWPNLVSDAFDRHILPVLAKWSRSEKLSDGTVLSSPLALNNNSARALIHTDLMLDCGFYWKNPGWVELRDFKDLSRDAKAEYNRSMVRIQSHTMSYETRELHIKRLNEIFGVR